MKRIVFAYTRLGHLGERPKRILQAAAVIGREFRFDTLRDVTQQAGMVEELLIALTQRGQIQLLRQAPERVYTFKHVLSQEAAYASLLRKDRRAIHLQVAEWWEHQDRDQVYTIARHFLAADSPARALPYLVEAGSRAARAYSVEEAFSL